MSIAGDLRMSAAGIEQGHRAFQEFLLAGERNVVSGLTRRGAEQQFAATFADLPGSAQSVLEGYFRRQSQLSLTQRTALLGPFVKLDIHNALTPGATRRVSRLRSAVRSELDSLGPRRFDLRGAAFSKLPGSIGDALADAGGQTVKPVKPDKTGVRQVDLMLDDVAVQASQDETLFQDDVDEVTLGVTMINETGVVTTKENKLESIEEGQSKAFNPPLTLGTIPVDIGLAGFPRSFNFKVDAVERDDGTYNDILDAGAKYIQDKVTEELIAAGLIKAGAAIGIPIPPPVAAYIASYLKTWTDDLIDWFVGLFRNDDDIVGSRSRMVRLDSSAFTLTEPVFFGADKTVSSKNGPLSGSPFSWSFTGADGRWRTIMHIQLR